MGEYYASFAGDGRHLGSAVVEARDEADALELMTESGLNPGGQALVIRVQPGIYPLGRLLSASEMEAIDGSRQIKDIPEDELEDLLGRIPESSILVCDGCNQRQT